MTNYKYEQVEISEGEDGRGEIKQQHHLQQQVYRIIKLEKKVRHALRITSTIIFIMALALGIVFFIGIRAERTKVQQAKPTLSNYLSSSVCACYGNDTTENDNTTNGKSCNSQTFPSKKEAIINGSLDILHCGDCGLCSTKSDIDLMISTKDTLTRDATQCAMKGFFIGFDTVDDCLETNIGFTPGCSVSLFSVAQ